MIYRLAKKIALIFIVVFILVLLINSTWFLKIFYPFPHQELIIPRSAEHQVDPYLVLAIIRTESKFQAKANSNAGAKGLMQIMPDTGSWIAKQMGIPDFTEEKLYQADYNIPMGIWYISYLNSVFGKDVSKVLAAYNAGEYKVKKWIAEGIWTGRQEDIVQIPYAETREYIDKVLIDYHIYKRIYEIQ